MKVLLAASEVAPIIKIGGLGDVIGSLPIALEKLGVDADVIVPFYPSAKIENLKLFKMFELNVPFDGQTHTVEIHRTKLPGSNVDVLLIKYAKYFDLGGASAFLKNQSETEMFSFFAKAVVEFIKAKFNTYDVIHCHDWHTGLITHLLQDELGDDRPGTLFTIHNLFYQGKGAANITKEIGVTPGAHPLIDYDISDGDINLLYQGITSSDYVSTVSPTYAEEIKTRTFGRELADTLTVRSGRLVGIINGVDYSFFPRDYDLNSWKTKKAEHKMALQKVLGLEIEEKKPIFSFISRIDPGQKGLDILLVSIEHMIENGGQFILLGTGDKVWEKKFSDLLEIKRYKGKISIVLKFNSALANEIYAGSDFFMVPSKYEPCGLTQMIAMHYGTPPIVRGVGGLKDTVKNGENGFVFSSYSSLELNKTLNKAFDIYSKPSLFNKMVENALVEDFSWDKSAVKYKDLYQKVINLRKDL